MHLWLLENLCMQFKVRDLFFSFFFSFVVVIGGSVVNCFFVFITIDFKIIFCFLESENFQDISFILSKSTLFLNFSVLFKTAGSFCGLFLFLLHNRNFDFLNILSSTGLTSTGMIGVPPGMVKDALRKVII